MKELERALRERDKVINELLQRVEALERRVGVRYEADQPDGGMEDVAAAGITVDTGNNRGSTPGRIVVDAKAAERALERSLSREGALLLPAGTMEIEPRIAYRREENASPILTVIGDEVHSGELTHRVNSLSAGLTLRMGLPWDSQVEFDIPFRWNEWESVTQVDFVPIDSTARTGSGLGDLRLGLAKTLLRESRWRPDLVARLSLDTDTGAMEDDGVPLGGGFHELQASLTAIKRQDPIAFIGGLSYQHSFEAGLIRPGSALSVNFGSFIALSPETSLRFVLSATRQDETEYSNTPIQGSDRFIGTLQVGGSTLLAPGILLNLSTGIGLTSDADDFSVLLSMPIRFPRPVF